MRLQRRSGDGDSMNGDLVGLRQFHGNGWRRGSKFILESVFSSEFEIQIDLLEFA